MTTLRRAAARGVLYLAMFLVALLIAARVTAIVADWHTCRANGYSMARCASEASLGGVY